MAVNGAGHRQVPHTADVRLEAWAPSRAGCVAEAVAAMVESFAVPAATARPGSARFTVAAAPAADQLAAVLDEVIFRLDTAGELPVRARAAELPDGAMEITAATVPAAEAALVGAVPKAVSLHELAFAGGPDGWRCRVTLDV